MGGGIVKAGTGSVIGIAEEFLLDGKAFVLVTVIRHWVKVRDLAFDNVVVALLKT